MINKQVDIKEILYNHKVNKPCSLTVNLQIKELLLSNVSPNNPPNCFLPTRVLLKVKFLIIQSIYCNILILHSGTITKHQSSTCTQILQTTFIILKHKLFKAILKFHTFIPECIFFNLDINKSRIKDFELRDDANM